MMSNNVVRLMPPVEMGGEVGYNFKYGCFVFKVEPEELENVVCFDNIFKVENKIFFQDKIFIVERVVFYPEGPENSPLYVLYPSALPSGFEWEEKTVLLKTSLLIRGVSGEKYAFNPPIVVGKEAKVLEFKKSA